MAEYNMYGFRKSKYPAWMERDLEWAYNDQFKMAIIMFFMLLAVVGVFLFFFVGISMAFWVGLIVASVVILACMVPLWRYAKKWVNDLSGTFYLRADSTDAGYQMLREKITGILTEAGFKFHTADRSFQSILGTAWLPDDMVITFTGEVRIVEMSFDITREEGLEIHLNSLSKFPGMEEKILSQLDQYFFVSLDGKVSVRV